MKYKIWPANSFEIHTPLSPEKVLEIVLMNTEPKKLFRMNRDHKYFEGKCSIEGFKIVRIIHYRNSFLPRIAGFIIREGEGSIVKIKMNLHPFVMVFAAVWFAGVIVGVVGVIAAIIAKPTEANPLVVVPFFMLLFGVAMVSGGFWSEASKQQEMLISLLESDKTIR